MQLDKVLTGSLGKVDAHWTSITAASTTLYSLVQCNSWCGSIAQVEVFQQKPLGVAHREPQKWPMQSEAIVAAETKEFFVD